MGTPDDSGAGGNQGGDNESTENNDNWFSKIFNSIGGIANSILEGLAAPFKAIKEGIGKLISYINPFDENFFVYKLIELFGDLLKWLFVPTESSFDSLQEKINMKFAFVNQIKEMFNSLLGYNNYSETLPAFSIDYEGQKMNIIDFSLFVDYRIWLHGIILAIAWFCYIRKLYNKLPALVGGV